MKRLTLILALVCTATVLASGYALAARTVMGLLVSNNVAHGYIRVESEGKDILLVPNKETKIMRGEKDKPVAVVTLAQLAPGDRIVAFIKGDETVVSIKGFYSLVKANLAGINDSTIKLEDGQTLTVSPDAKIMLPSGKNGRLADFKAGTAITCRLDPIKRTVWGVSATKSADVKLPAVSKAPRIESVTYETPAEPKPGDILSVKVAGTPKSSVRIEISGISTESIAEETEPGVYMASIKVPENASVTDIPVVAHMTANGKDAKAVQAARLLTVRPVIVEPAPVPIPVPTPAPEPPQPAPAPAPAPEPPPIKAIVVTEPVNGASVLSSLTIKGTAQPDAKISVQVSYNNGRLGLLELAGTVTAQLAAADKDGAFNVGPLSLTGLLATKNLSYHIEVTYVDLAGQAPVIVDVYGAK